MLKKLVLAALAFICSSAVFAVDTLYIEELPLQFSSIITLTGGVGWASSPGKNQYLYPNPLPQYNYYITILQPAL